MTKFYDSDDKESDWYLEVLLYRLGEGFLLRLADEKEETLSTIILAKSQIPFLIKKLREIE